MSPIAARGVLRAAAGRQVSSARKVTRAFEYHPYTRLSSERVSDPAYGKLAKNVATRLVFFAPSITALFAMPFIGYAFLQGHV